MKRAFLLLNIIFATVLSACEFETFEPNCQLGYTKVDGTCIKDDVLNCGDNQVLINGTCEEQSKLCAFDEYIKNNKCYKINSDNTRNLVPSECATIENIDDWQPTFCEEFTINGYPDVTLFDSIVGQGGSNTYFAYKNSDSMYVDEDRLHIDILDEGFYDNDYISSRVISINSLHMTYGKIQIKAKFPSANNAVSGIYLTNKSIDNLGEETILLLGHNDETTTDTVTQGMIGSSQTNVTDTTLSLDAFHVFELDIEPGKVTFYLDGVKTSELSMGVSNQQYPFYILLESYIQVFSSNLTDLNRSLEVEYIRIFEKEFTIEDTENPEPPTNVTFNRNGSIVEVAWDHSMDDTYVKAYDVFVDGSFYTTVDTNRILLENIALYTAYDLEIVAIDATEKRSEPLLFTLYMDQTLSSYSRIEAEDYVETFDTQTETCYDIGGGENVGYINQGSSLTYEIRIEESGIYEVDFRIASDSKVSTFEFLMDDALKTTVSFNPTGGWQTWQTVTSSRFYMEQGTYTFTILTIESGYNINYFEFKKVD